MKVAGAAAEITNVQGMGLAEINRQTSQFYPEDMLSEQDWRRPMRRAAS